MNNMGKSLINATTTDPSGQVSTTYNGNNIDKLDIVIEDNFFDGKYNHLTNIPETFPPQPHTHDINAIIDIENIFDTHINNMLEDLLESLEDDNNGD